MTSGDGAYLTYPRPDVLRGEMSVTALNSPRPAGLQRVFYPESAIVIRFTTAPAAGMLSS